MIYKLLIFKDGVIRGYLPDVEEPLFQLEGHKENVTSLYLSKFGTLISASWDKTAKVKILLLVSRKRCLKKH